MTIQLGYFPAWLYCQRQHNPVEEEQIQASEIANREERRELRQRNCFTGNIHMDLQIIHNILLYKK